MQVLRTVFFLLVLGNLLLFVWGQGYLGTTGGGSEAERLSVQIEPDRLRIAGQGAPPAAKPQQEECRALAGLEQEAADRLVQLLSGRDPEIRVDRHIPAEPKSWWVNIPPQPNGAQADKKAAELSKLGVKDFYVVRESGPNQYAISLGLFKNEASAKDYLAVLQKKNVKSARILSREAAGGKSVIEVRGSPERLARVLADLPAEFTAAQKAECTAAKP